jgi:hypothetical protein
MGSSLIGSLGERDPTVLGYLMPTKWCRGFPCLGQSTLFLLVFVLTPITIKIKISISKYLKSTVWRVFD